MKERNDTKVQKMAKRDEEQHIWNLKSAQRKTVRTCFSPVKSTFIKAIEADNFTTWPNLTEHNVKQNLEKSEATIKGHMNQQRKNVRSTNPREQLKTSATEEINEPEVEPHLTEHMNLIYTAIYDNGGHIYMDLTGRFPSVLGWGYMYSIVLYYFDTNNILTEPMKNRSDSEAICIYNELTSKGLKSMFQTIDNEALEALKKNFTARNMKFQLVAPHVHQQNAAERAIQTFTNHFLIGICSTNKKIPLHLWDMLIPHSVLTLNLLRQLRVKPKLSAYAQLNGPFDFNPTPVAPPGSRVIFHEKPRQRKTWAPHGVNGFYLGPAMERYRYHRVYCSMTG
jgi:hypothetical protein